MHNIRHTSFTVNSLTFFSIVPERASPIKIFFRRRLINCGFSGAKAYDMVQVYDSIPIAERNRIERLEMLDEGEYAGGVLFFGGCNERIFNL